MLGAKEIANCKESTQYQSWFDRYPNVFKSQENAFRQMLPGTFDRNKGINIGLGSSRFSKTLDLLKGVEPSVAIRRANRASKNGELYNHEFLPYEDESMEFVVLNFCICLFPEIHPLFKEISRILEPDGLFIIGFMDKDSSLKRPFQDKNANKIMYFEANTYRVDKMLVELNNANYQDLTICQTLFNSLTTTHTHEPVKAGYGEGSFVVIKAKKEGKCSNNLYMF